MVRLPYRTLMAAIVLATAPSIHAQDLKSDQEHILGTWIVKSAREEGKEVADLQKAQFTFAKDGRLTLKLGSVTEPLELRYSLVMDKGKGIDISPPPINDKDRNPGREKDRGIYKLEGDTLTLCICDGPGADPQAPKDFNVQARFVTLVVLQEGEEVAL